jgi:hypothetical protein
MATWCCRGWLIVASTPRASSLAMTSLDFRFSFSASSLTVTPSERVIVSGTGGRSGFGFALGSGDGSLVRSFLRRLRPGPRGGSGAGRPGRAGRPGTGGLGGVVGVAPGRTPPARARACARSAGVGIRRAGKTRGFGAPGRVGALGAAAVAAGCSTLRAGLPDPCTGAAGFAATGAGTGCSASVASAAGSAAGGGLSVASSACCRSISAISSRSRSFSASRARVTLRRTSSAVPESRTLRSDLTSRPRRSSSSRISAL